MSIITGDVKYSACELEAIVKQGMLAAGFILQSEIIAKSEPDNGIRLRTSNAIEHIFTVYQKQTNETTRKIVLFDAAKDTDDKDPLTEISSLESVLKIFTLQKYSDDNLELMIPLIKCNQWANHWNFLHIVKKNNRYTAKIYEPKGFASFKIFYPHSYIKNTLDKYFPNCKFEIEYLGQQSDDTICGVCTAENMISKVRKLPFSGNIKKDEDIIRLKHVLMYKQEHPEWQEKEETKFVIKKEIKNEKKINIDGHEWDMSMESDAAIPLSSEATSLPASEQDHSASLNQGVLDLPKELIEEKYTEIPLDKEKRILTAKDYLFEIQRTIFNTKDWKTGLGGEDVDFYTKDRDYINSASVPFGVREILNEIKRVQDNENNFENAFVKIQAIARKRLYQPRFSCCLFKVRSDLTTNFYSWIAQLDRNGTITPSISPPRLR